MNIVQYYVQGRMDKIDKIFHFLNKNWFEDNVCGFGCDGSDFTDDYLYCFILASAKSDYIMMNYLLKKYEWMDDLITDSYLHLCKICVDKRKCEHECPFRVNYKNIVNYYYDDMNAFIFACEDNNIKMIKYLYNLHKKYTIINKVSDDILYKGFMRLIRTAYFRESYLPTDNIYSTVKYYINNLMDEKLIIKFLDELNTIGFDFDSKHCKLYCDTGRLLTLKLFKLTHIIKYIQINRKINKYDNYNYMINYKYTNSFI